MSCPGPVAPASQSERWLMSRLGQYCRAKEKLTLLVPNSCADSSFIGDAVSKSTFLVGHLQG
jgi:hypothetical protein